MWRFLCLAFLVEVSFASRIPEKVEKKPVILANDKLKTEETARPMIEVTIEKVLEMPMVKSKSFRKPVVTAKSYRSGLDHAIPPTNFDDLEKMTGRPIVEEFRYPYRDEDDETVHPMIEEKREKVLEMPMVKSKSLRKPVVTAQSNRTGLVVRAVFPTNYDDLEKMKERPIVEEFRHPYRDEDVKHTLHRSLKIPVVSLQKFGNPYLYKLDSDEDSYDDIKERRSLEEKLNTEGFPTFPTMFDDMEKMSGRPIVEKYRYPIEFDHVDTRKKPVVTDEGFPTFTTLFDDMEKMSGRPIVEEYRYPIEFDHVDITDEKPRRVLTSDKALHHKMTTKPVVAAETVRDKFLDDFDFDDLEERYDFDDRIIPDFNFKIDRLLETDNIDQRRKICIMGVHRTVYYLAEFKRTGIIPELALKNKRQAKRLIKKVLDLPVKIDIKEEEKDIERVEKAMNLPTTRLTPKLRKMNRELVTECGEKYPVLS